MFTTHVRLAEGSELDVELGAELAPGGVKLLGDEPHAVPAQGLRPVQWDTAVLAHLIVDRDLGRRLCPSRGAKQEGKSGRKTQHLELIYWRMLESSVS